MEEIWKPIPNYEGIYEVSNTGRVVSLKNGKRRDISGASRRDGYRVLKLRNFGSDGDFYLHRILATAFIDNPNKLPYVNHIDGNPSNNIISNLEWVSARENVSHGFKNKKCSSKYAGVHFCNQAKKWRASFRLEGKRKFIGHFLCETAAHIAYVKTITQNKISNRYS